MNRGLLCFALCVGTLTPMTAEAATMDEPTKLHLRCGAGYLLVSSDPEMNNTPEEEARLRQMGEILLTRADTMLTELGMTHSERVQVGAHYMAEMDAVLTNDFDLGFDPSQCADLVATAEAAALQAKIDVFMVCGAGFLATAQVSKAEGDDETAEKLEALGNTLAGRGDDFMIEAGLSDTERYELGREYGQSVWTKVLAGEDLAYDWDICAGLES